MFGSEKGHHHDHPPAGYGSIELGESSHERLVNEYDLGESAELEKQDQKGLLNHTRILTDGNQLKSDDHSLPIQLAINASWLVNWFLFGAKAFAVIISSSKAVTAALADSAVDLASQAILSLANYYITKYSPNYPVGRSRLEALSVIGCAFIMCMTSLEVNGFNGEIPVLNVDLELYLILGLGIILKLLLWIYCLRLNTTVGSDTVVALAEDHFNDVISNTAAVITAAIAFNTTAWWFDPLSAILISLVIIYRWGEIIHEQVKKIVGHIAPPEFIQQIEQLANDHDERIQVDCTRVYHFGARYNVEMEIVLPGQLTVVESHDVALELQQKIENIPDVERAFVHVDHQRRDVLEHKVERELVNNALHDGIHLSM